MLYPVKQGLGFPDPCVSRRAGRGQVRVLPCPSSQLVITGFASILERQKQNSFMIFVAVVVVVNISSVY